MIKYYNLKPNLRMRPSKLNMWFWLKLSSASSYLMRSIKSANCCSSGTANNWSLFQMCFDIVYWIFCLAFPNLKRTEWLFLMTEIFTDVVQGSAGYITIRKGYVNSLTREPAYTYVYCSIITEIFFVVLTLGIHLDGDHKIRTQSVLPITLPY